MSQLKNKRTKIINLEKIEEQKLYFNLNFNYIKISITHVSHTKITC